MNQSSEEQTQTLAALEQELIEIEAVERNSGYEFCDICGRYDEDAGGIDYWVWKGKKWCYGGCWEKLKTDLKEKIKVFKNSN